MPELDERYLVQKKTAEEEEDAQSVDHAIDKTGAGGGRKIFGWDRNFFDPKPKVSCLNKYFLIEDEVIGVEREGNLFESAPAISSVARVIFGQLEPQRPIFQTCQKSVANKFPPRHTLLECVPPPGIENLVRCPRRPP